MTGVSLHELVNRFQQPIKKTAGVSEKLKMNAHLTRYHYHKSYVQTLYSKNKSKTGFEILFIFFFFFHFQHNDPSLSVIVKGEMAFYAKRVFHNSQK